MTEMVTISAKIERKKKDQLEEFGVTMSALIKKAVDAELKAQRREKAIRELKEVAPLFRKVSKEEWIQAIRETRDQR